MCTLKQRRSRLQLFFLSFLILDGISIDVSKGNILTIGEKSKKKSKKIQLKSGTSSIRYQALRSSDSQILNAGMKFLINMHLTLQLITHRKGQKL